MDLSIRLNIFVGGLLLMLVSGCQEKPIPDVVIPQRPPSSTRPHQAVAAIPSPVTDVITFGDGESERNHNLLGQRSDVVSGGLGQSARRLLPLEPQSWEGGSLTFRLRVEPEKANYATIRLWGSDVSADRLILFCEGQQIGYRQLGDIDILDDGAHDPAYLGRFRYSTIPLPLEMTRGKTNLNFEIRCTGPIWRYGNSFEKYQKPMTEPTRGIYRFYTHTDGYFVAPADEQQGVPPKDAAVRKSPGPEVLDLIKERANHVIEGGLQSKGTLDESRLSILAKAYDLAWTPAYRNPVAIQQVIKCLDTEADKYRKNPALVENDSWGGLGVYGRILHQLAGPLKPYLDETRRKNYSTMLAHSRDWRRTHRRAYANQSQIVDLIGIYYANQGVAVVDPAKALSETEARRYLYESMGILPWLGSDTTNGSAKPYGDHFYLVTDKGLTKELGYVGGYGEVAMILMGDIYDATRPVAGQPGDAKILAKIGKVARARSVFRYPSLDGDGNRAMRLELPVSWRDLKYPGDIVYGMRTDRAANELKAAALTLDPYLVGFAQQMLEDNQYFAAEANALQEGVGSLYARMDSPSHYELIRAQPANGHRLPMSSGQPDFVFSDEEDGVVAIKHGDEILYASLYWRARYAINFLARIHYMTPSVDRMAVVRQDTQFEPSGLFYTRPDWINHGFGNGGVGYPGKLHSAHAGEKLPIPKMPLGADFKPGNESFLAGRGDFYTCHYGPFSIAMNCTAARVFTITVPQEGVTVRLPSQDPVKGGAVLTVSPRSTVVLYRSK